MLWVHFTMIILPLLALAKRDRSLLLWAASSPPKKVSESLIWALGRVVALCFWGCLTYYGAPTVGQSWGQGSGILRLP